MKNELINIALVLGSFLLIGNFTIFPFIFHSKDIENLCHELSINAKAENIENIKFLAEKKGFSLSVNNKDQKLTIYDKRTMGKLTCHIDYSENDIKIEYFSD
ncbi:MULTISPECIES: hypothetical protein [unclassified Psychrobacter]|uniref:hypothetical protein n=1 Tax=unclassified Psychrobacter TaxID=196806 RepID=UPI0025B2BF35|nr:MULTISPECIES: hypothetical protein [unclassified Psychrobacter]MDN3452955.1 hypothetical protein [Psychrobacter sp. APC 3350]MDN3501524.1 hypothetical protein [Psychrobacter sp. 5A.1]